MTWIDLPATFFENNPRFVGDLIYARYYPRGTLKFFGPMTYRTVFVIPNAVVEEAGMWMIGEAEEQVFRATLWNMDRNVGPDTNLQSCEPDLKIEVSLLPGEYKWEFYGKARSQFLKSKLGKDLNDEIFLSKMHAISEFDEDGKLMGARL